MSWSEFIGNPGAVEQVRGLIAGGRAQRTLVLEGPEGVGKTTLALMAGLALNCLAPPAPGDFCGTCASCVHFGGVDGLDELEQTALEYREQEFKTRARELAPLVLAPHPAIRVYPPDGDYFSMIQARAVIHQSTMMPDSGRTWCLVLPEFERARWMVQAAMLKTLEEPPGRTALILLVRNPWELLPTVRSRAMMVRLQPLPEAELAAELAARGVGEAEMSAHWAQGCPGRALQLDPEAYRRQRQEALGLLQAALEGPQAAGVFRVTETVRAGKEKFESLLEILYSVLQDIQYLQSGLTEAIRNVDCVPELTRLSRRLPWDRLEAAVTGLDRMQAAARRNANRSLALDAWSAELGGTRPQG